jgi:ribosomal protein L11 methyltransferase
MSNQWWEIKITASPNLEESIFWRLENFGCKGMSTEINGDTILLKAYTPYIKTKLLDLSALSLWLEQDAVLVGESLPHTTWNLIDEEDWSSSWKQHWEPQEIGAKLLICPAWLEPPVSDRVVLKLDPGVAFGTGTHPTTQLCLEALEMRLGILPNLTIADIGCGSGILSTASLLLGASKLYCVDNDPLAVKATRENMALNNMDDSCYIVTEGSIPELISLIPEPVDGFVCNILADIIIQLAPLMGQLVKPKAWGILSGVLSTQVPEVSNALEAQGWTVGAVWRKQDWSCLNIRR